MIKNNFKVVKDTQSRIFNYETDLEGFKEASPFSFDIPMFCGILEITDLPEEEISKSVFLGIGKEGEDGTRLIFNYEDPQFKIQQQVKYFDEIEFNDAEEFICLLDELVPSFIFEFVSDQHQPAEIERIAYEFWEKYISVNNN